MPALKTYIKDLALLRNIVNQSKPAKKIKYQGMFSPIQTEREMTLASPRGDVSERAGGINNIPSAFSFKQENLVNKQIIEEEEENEKEGGSSYKEYYFPKGRNCYEIE